MMSFDFQLVYFHRSAVINLCVWLITLAFFIHPFDVAPITNGAIYIIRRLLWLSFVIALVDDVQHENLSKTREKDPSQTQQLKNKTKRLLPRHSNAILLFRDRHKSHTVIWAIPNEQGNFGISNRPFRRVKYNDSTPYGSHLDAMRDYMCVLDERQCKEEATRIESLENENIWLETVSTPHICLSVLYLKCVFFSYPFLLSSPAAASIHK